MDLSNVYNYTFFGLPSWMTAQGSRVVCQPSSGLTGRWLIGVNYTSLVHNGTDSFWVTIKDIGARNSQVRYFRGILEGDAVVDNIYKTNNIVVIIPFRIASMGARSFKIAIKPPRNGPQTPTYLRSSQLSSATSDTSCKWLETKADMANNNTSS